MACMIYPSRQSPSISAGTSTHSNELLGRLGSSVINGVDLGLGVEEYGKVRRALDEAEELHS